MIRAIGTLVVIASAVVGGIYCVRTAFEVGAEFEEGRQALEQGGPGVGHFPAWGQRHVESSDDGLYIEQTESLYDSMQRQYPAIYGDESGRRRGRDRDER